MYEMSSNGPLIFLAFWEEYEMRYFKDNILNVMFNFDLLNSVVFRIFSLLLKIGICIYIFFSILFLGV